jgi:hypothetical protein
VLEPAILWVRGSDADKALGADEEEETLEWFGLGGD